MHLETMTITLKTDSDSDEFEAENLWGICSSEIDKISG